MSRHLARTFRFARAPKSTGWCIPRHVSTVQTSSGSGLHTRRGLEYPIENGLGDFLTPEGLRTIAVDWQEGLLDKLNEEVKDTELKNQSVMQVVLSTATQKSASLAFMYASQALNNSFFLDNLKPLTENQESHESDISPDLLQKIANDFGDLTHLKSTMSAAALGMSINGWVWLVQDANGSLGVVPTFGPGTVLVQNRKSRSPPYSTLVGEMAVPKSFGQDSTSPSPTAASPLSGNVVPRTPAPTDKSRSPSTREYNSVPSYASGDIDSILSLPHIADFSKIGDILSPLFCISVHEHAWMSSGYGVWGKEEYLKGFWPVLDWAKVSRTSKLWVGSAVQ